MGLISSSFSFNNCATMSSMAFFTRVNASNLTLTARVAKRGFSTFFDTAVKSLEACPAVTSHRALLLQKRWVESLREQIMSVVRAEDRQSLGACFHLQLTSLLPLLPF